MSAPAQVNARPRSPGSVLLWFAVLAGPSAWVLQLYVGAYLTDVFCRRGAGDSLGRVFGLSNPTFVTVLTSITAAVALAALVASVYAYRKLKIDDASTGGRALWMARIGVLDSALFGILIVFMYVASARLSECTPSL
jgi:hypothetical protein